MSDPWGDSRESPPPLEGVLNTDELRKQPFGARRAPANWGRVAEFAQWALGNFCYVYLAKFVDECFAVEPGSARLPASQTAMRISELLGLMVEDRNEWAPMEIIEISGDQSRLDASLSMIGCQMRRRRGW